MAANAAAAAAEKQKALVDAIAAGVKAELAEPHAKITASINAVLARLDMLETTFTANGTAAKRAVKGAGKGPAGAKAAKKPVSDDDPMAKVTNSALFFRYNMINDIDGAREQWGTEDRLADAASDATVAKRKNGEPEWWGAVGTYIWRHSLNDEEKKEVKAAFDAMKEARTRDNTDAPLNEEAGEATA